MFEIGRRYKITSSEPEGGTSNRYAEVLEWSSPLLKIASLGSYEVINTASTHFISAEPDDEVARHEKEKAAAGVAERFRAVVSMNDEQGDEP